MAASAGFFWQFPGPVLEIDDTRSNNRHKKKRGRLEKRIGERQETSLSVEILDPPHLGKVALVTRNLSTHGAFILLDKDKCPPVGRIVSLRVPGHLWGEKLSTVSARVVRVTEEGMGLQFLDFDFR